MGTAGQSITLANSIIGVGILAMPFCFQRCGVLLATLILLSMGLVSRLCCHFLLKSALLARRRNFEFLAFHVFGPAGKFAVEVGIIGFLMGTCIAYFVVVGDLGPQIIAKMFNINQSDILRTSIMVVVSLVCVLPLGLLRNVDSLSNVSAAAICFYFCLVMKVIAEAASQLLTGDWHTRVDMWKPYGLLQCVPIFSMALFCQTQLFEIFESLPSLSLEKMNLVTKNAINICTGVYFTLGLFGYIAFSSQEISGNVLISLSPTMASDVIKLGFVMSVAFSFPLIIFPCRASLYSLLYKKVHSSHHDHIINHSIPETTFRCITVAIIGVSLFTSLLIPNIELVLGLVGSTIGVLICVVFPAACFVNVTFKNTNERVLAKAAMALGLIIMVLGTYGNLQAAEMKLERYDDRLITQERIDKIVEDFFEKREKLDDGRVKSLLKDESLPLYTHKIDNNIMKDSEMQPPNPVPPDSSNEKTLKVNIEDLKDSQIVDILPEVKEDIAKLSDLHPKDVKTKLNEAKQVNSGSSEGKIGQPKIDQDSKASSNEDKLHIIKQQQLIETIKQHGEEQKELMKEQKDILDEIIKAKKELQENKNEADSKEAKKIAVESIKQIANMAIQSIGGVTEKPNKEIKDEKKAEHLEKLTNEAVQEIAKKAVETIEAIQEIKENPDKSIIKSENEDLKSNKNILSNLNKIGNSQDNKENINDGLVNAVKAKLDVQNNIQIGKTSEDIKNQQNLELSNKQLGKVSIQNPVNTHVNTNNLNVEKTHLNPKIDIGNANMEKQGYKQTINNNPVVNKIIAQASDKTQSHNAPVSNQSDLKPYSHSLNEPQSYKQGEDSRKIPEIKPNSVVVPNLPIPLASNDVEHKSQIVYENVQKKPELEPIASKLANIKKIEMPKSNAVSNNGETNIIHPSRQKRDVLDCTKKTDLLAEEKEIWENRIEQQNDFLPEVNLNDALSKRLPADADLLHHNGRSLKSYDVKDEDR